MKNHSTSLILLLGVDFWCWCDNIDLLYLSEYNIIISYIEDNLK